jgi:NAD(P)-dependent dehydrogenase (short-subunit alcohol dehydrogenase family)
MEIGGVAAIVAGGAAGLGEATVRGLAAGGAKVAIFDLDAGRGQRLAAEVGGRFFAVDITDDIGVTEAVAQARRDQGIARILVNCAGAARRTKIIEDGGVPHTLEDFRKTVEINLVGSFNMMVKFVASLLDADDVGEERGVIVNTASVSAFDGMMGNSAYSASKAGLVGMTLPAARDLADHAIRVMTIAPGTFLTPMLLAQPRERREWLAGQALHPPRLGNPSEFAKLVEAIIANPMLNGEVIRLDGGTRKNFRG